jgi:hypothetical protein
MTIVNEIRSACVIVDTESYAGNFELEMGVYLTGQFGEGRVGPRERAMYAGDIAHLGWWDRHTAPQEGENGPTPVAIHPTRGWFNNGMGKHFRDTPENHALAHSAAVNSMREYRAPVIARAQARLDAGDFEETPNGWTREACERMISTAQAEIARLDKGGNRFPAYQSVALFVDEMPPAEVLEELFARADAFATEIYPDLFAGIRPPPITITGFRFVSGEVEQALTPPAGAPKP